MNDFKWKHFRGEIILGCVRWYCKYGIRALLQLILIITKTQIVRKIIDIK
jgi:transposase-like protein